MSELKPCPMCGGKAELYDGQECWGHGDFPRFVGVRCRNCFTQGKRIYDVDVPSNFMKQFAIEMWNKRVGDK